MWISECYVIIYVKFVKLEAFTVDDMSAGQKRTEFLGHRSLKSGFILL